MRLNRSFVENGSSGHPVGRGSRPRPKPRRAAGRGGADFFCLEDPSFGQNNWSSRQKNWGNRGALRLAQPDGTLGLSRGKGVPDLSAFGVIAGGLAGPVELESGGSARLEPQKSIFEFVVNAEFAVEAQGDGVSLDRRRGPGSDRSRRPDAASAPFPRNGNATRLHGSSLRIAMRSVMIGYPFC